MKNMLHPRIAARAVIVHANRLLLVNAYPGQTSDLWCAPGGGVIVGQSLPETLAREVMEETGLQIDVGAPCLINEFHSPKHGFHQIEVFFRAQLRHGTHIDPSACNPDWNDPAGVVNRRRFFSRAEMATLRHKPDSLAQIAWGPADGIGYDPLELIVP